ncbi:TetR/AcrR family transcriptional regulator [Pseudonocardia sp. CA-107938]|uniref:TetR/AcrR family transcriptional regulator n=1 Tax=Pseudonocardia sp. CA-107938 TaxID=3240021 RepID=UPI003D94F2A6
MDPATGLRERKKQRTREAIADAAIAMFLEHGFDAVSCAAVAARAEVSKPTLFKHFPTKEDLVVHRIADHEDELARVVRERAAGESPLAALCRHYLAGLAAGDAITGLTDAPQVRALYRMMQAAPTLSARLREFTARRAEALAEALAGGRPDLVSRVVAHQITTTLHLLADENVRRIAGGETAAELHAEAVAAAEQAFEVLRSGIGDAYT